MTRIKPLQDRIVVERIEEEEQQKGGIIIPDTAKEKPQQGIVVEVGLGRVDKDGKRVPMEVKKGDKIIFSKYPCRLYSNPSSPNSMSNCIQRKNCR